MHLRTLPFAALAVAFPLSAQAQDLTDAELLELFQTQRSAFKEASESGLGKTRGLTVVTVESAVAPDAPATDAPELVASPTEDSAPSTGGTGDSGTIVTATPNAPSQTAPDAQPVVRTSVAAVMDRELQVNVRIEFEFDSAALSASQKPKLVQLCKVMKDSDINLFRIVGHTDASGSDAYNMNLSLLRAEEVKRYFTSECGMAPSRLEAMGLGETLLYNTEDPNAGENRRVEFQALS